MASPVVVARLAPDLPADADGTCPLCGACGWGHDPASVISGNFLDHDRLPFRNRPTLAFCGPCAGGFRNRVVRQQPSEVTSNGLRLLSPSALRAALSHPIGGDRAVCVPVQGRKHLLPWLQWGELLSDAGPSPWRAEDVELLALVERLRSFGFGEAALREPAPRWVVLNACDDPEDVLASWSRLRSWRQDQTIEVAIRATRRVRANDA